MHINIIHHRVSDGEIRHYASLGTGLLLKTKGRKDRVGSHVVSAWIHCTDV